MVEYGLVDTYMRGPLPSLYLAHLPPDSWRLSQGFFFWQPDWFRSGRCSRSDPGTGASLVRGRSLGIGSVGCTRHPSKKYIPGKGRISCSGPVCATICPVRALYNPEGRHTYVGKGVYDQLRRHTGRPPGTGDSAQESICVQLPALLFDFLEAISLQPR